MRRITIEFRNCRFNRSFHSLPVERRQFGCQISLKDLETPLPKPAVTPSHGAYAIQVEERYGRMVLDNSIPEDPFCKV